MTKICDLKRIFSIFLILFITTVSTQNLSPALCGGLHSGMDPCKECSNSQSVLVKAQTLPKPLVVETAANQLTSRPMPGRRHNLRFLQNLKVSNKRRPHLRNSVVMEMKPIGSERPVQYIPQVQQVHQAQRVQYIPQTQRVQYIPQAQQFQQVQQFQQAQQVQQVQQEIPNINPSFKLAPRFHPIGDLCFNKKENKPEAVSRLSEATIITPANPPKIECYTESSPVMGLGSSSMLNTMTNSQVILDDSAFQIPQISSGSSRTKFKVDTGSRRYSKPRGGSVSVDRTLKVNPTSSNIQMRDHIVDLSAQSLNRVRTNRLKSNVMKSGVMIDNAMNRNINVYPGSSAVIGVAPIASGVQRRPYSLTPGAAIFGSSVKLLSGNSNREFISDSSKENSAISLNVQERMYKGESAPSAPLDNHPADLVSVNLKYQQMLKSYQQAAANAAGINPISTEKIHEEKLAFGPQKTPIDDQVKVTFKEIPEEKLHIVEKPVIELKLDQPSETSRSFEEPAPFISYGHLGFQEKTFNGPILRDRSVDAEAPKINLEQRIDAQISPEDVFQYLTPSIIAKGQLVPIKSASSEYVPTKPLLRSMDSYAHQLYPPAQSYVHESKTDGSNYELISEQRRYNQQLATINNQMPLALKNQPICYCPEE